MLKIKSEEREQLIVFEFHTVFMTAKMIKPKTNDDGEDEASDG